MSKKRLRRERAKLREMERLGMIEAGPPEESPAEEVKETRNSKAKKGEGILGKARDLYEGDYKKLLIIPMLIFILAIAQIGYQIASTGDFINKGVSLKGGITVTVPDTPYDPQVLGQKLADSFKGYDISVRELTAAGTKKGVTIDADMTQKEDIDNFLENIRETLGITSEDYSVDMIGSSLGSSFFRETIIAMFVAFIFMGIVVFLYFRIPIPSLAVILCALSDIVVTLAVVNVSGMKISTGGIAAFLMLIGYSVDTDILLTTRVLRRRSGTIMDGVYSAMRTGLAMTMTTMTATIVAIIFSKSAVLKEIMVIILIGLFADIIYTWIQNTALLRWYLEKNPKKVEIKMI